MRSKRQEVEQSSDIFFPLFTSVVDLFLTPFDEYMNKLKKEFSNLPVSVNSYYGRIEGCEIRYVRCANKFIVGIYGGYNDAVLLRNLIKDFFNKELLLFTLNMDILKITKNSNYVEFLGYSIIFPAHQPNRNNFLNQRLSPSAEQANLKNFLLPIIKPELIISKKAIKE